MHPQKGIRQRAARILAALQASMPFGSQAAANGAAAVKTVRSFLSRLDDLATTDAESIETSFAPLYEEVPAALRILLMHRSDAAFKLVHSLQEHMWLITIPSIWATYSHAQNPENKAMQERRRDVVHRVADEIFELVTSYLKDQYDNGKATDQRARRGYERGAKDLISLAIKVLTWDHQGLSAFIGLTARSKLYAFLYRLGESSRYGRPLLRTALAPEDLGQIWVTWTTWEESYDTLTLAWGLRPLVAKKGHKGRKAMIQHYRSFFQAYVEGSGGPAATGQSERKEAVETMLSLLVDAKKEDWEAVVAQLHQLVGELDITKPQIFRSFTVQSYQEASARWATWPRISAGTSHKVIVDEALSVEWYEHESEENTAVKIAFGSLRNVTVDENKSATSEKATMQYSLTLEAPDLREVHIDAKTLLGPRIRLALDEEGGPRIWQALKQRGVLCQLNSHKNSKRVKMDLLPPAIDKFVTTEPPGHPATTFKASIAPRVTPPLSAFSEGEPSDRHTTPMSRRRNEVAHLAGLQETAALHDQIRPVHPAQLPARSPVSDEDDSELTDLSEEEPSSSIRAVHAMQDTFGKGVSPSGAFKQNSKTKPDTYVQTARPDSLVLGPTAVAPAQTFRKHLRQKRGRGSVSGDSDNAAEEAPNSDFAQKRQRHKARRSEPMAKAPSSHNKKKTTASDPPMGSQSETTRKRSSRSADPDGNTIAARLDVVDRTPNDSIVQRPRPVILTQAQSPLKTSTGPIHTKKKLTAEWMSASNAKLVKLRMESTQSKVDPDKGRDASDNVTSDSAEGGSASLREDHATKAASRDGNLPGNGTTNRGMQEKGNLRPADANGDDDNGICADLADPPVVHRRTGARHEVSSYYASHAEMVHRNHTSEEASVSSDPESPSQRVLVRQQNRFVVLEDQTANEVSLKGSSTSLPDIYAHTTGRHVASEAKEPDLTDQPAAKSSRNKERNEMSKTTSLVGEDWPFHAQDHDRKQNGSDTNVAALQPLIKAPPVSEKKVRPVGRSMREHELEPLGKAGFNKSFNRGMQASTYPASSQTATCAAVDSRRGKDQLAKALKDLPPTPKSWADGAVEQLKRSPAADHSNLVTASGLKMVMEEDPQESFLLDADALHASSKLPVARDELEELLVKGMNGLRELYKGLANSGFSDNIEEMEDPACDQKSSTVVALESAARTTIKLGQFLYDLASKKDEQERKERDELNRRKISDKVDAMSERLQGVMNEAGDVIQVLQTVDSWVNRHEVVKK